MKVLRDLKDSTPLNAEPRHLKTLYRRDACPWGYGASVLPVRPLVHPGVELRANVKSISHRCYLCEVAFVRELTKETSVLALGCLQGGFGAAHAHVWKAFQLPCSP